MGGRSLWDTLTNILNRSPKSRTWLLIVHNKYQLHYFIHFIHSVRQFALPGMRNYSCHCLYWRDCDWCVVILPTFWICKCMAQTFIKGQRREIVLLYKWKQKNVYILPCTLSAEIKTDLASFILYHYTQSHWTPFVKHEVIKPKTKAWTCIPSVVLLTGYLAECCCS